VSEYQRQIALEGGQMDAADELVLHEQRAQPITNGEYNERNEILRDHPR
jgi:hypothetical protein